MKKKHKDEEKNDAKKTGEGAMDDDERDDLEDNSDVSPLGVESLRLLYLVYSVRVSTGRPP